MSRRVVLAMPPHVHAPGPLARFGGFFEPPLGLAFLASSIRAAYPDTTLDIIDAPALGLSPETFTDGILRREPDVVCLSVATPTAEAVRRACRRIRAERPSCRILVGGSHPTAMPGHPLPDADIAVIGEGERTIVELLDDRDPRDIAGIAFWENGAARVTAPRAPIDDLDTIPPPAYDLLPLERYRYPYPLRAPRGHYMTAMSSRGCPGHCAFCATTWAWGDRVRGHSAERVAGEARTLAERFGVSLLYFYDDTFLALRERAFEICERLGGARRKPAWVCQGRADEVDDEICAALARAGCLQIEIGVETGEERVLAKSGKSIDHADVRRAFAAAHRAGLETKGNFVFGFPAETTETIRKTTAMAVAIDPTYANFFHLVPYPGTPYYALYERSGWLATRDFDDFVYHGRAVVSVPGAPAPALDAAKRRATARFYLRPRKIAAIAGILWRTRRLGTIARGAASLVNALVRR